MKGKDKSQLNIKIDPQLLLKLKAKAIKSGKTLTAFVSELLERGSIQATSDIDILEKRLLRIEKLLNLKDNFYFNKEIFINSSNIVISKTVNNLSNIDIYKLCKNFGFGAKTGLPFKNESKGKLRNLETSPIEILESAAKSLLALGKLDECQHILQKVLAKDSNHFEALVDTGVCLSRQEKFRLALDYFNKAQNIEPKNIKISQNLFY